MGFKWTVVVLTGSCILGFASVVAAFGLLLKAKFMGALVGAGVALACAYLAWTSAHHFWHLAEPYLTNPFGT